MKTDNFLSGLVNQPVRHKYKYQLAMLIDDNYIDNYISEKIIRACHFSKKTYTAINGMAALDLVNELIRSDADGSELFPDIILVDLNMPVMDGFEFINEFRLIENEQLCKCKIVVLTSSIHDADKAKVLGIDSSILFVSKPISVQKLNTL